MNTHPLPKGHTMTTIDRAAEVISLALADDADVSIFGNHNDIATVSEATLDGKYDLTAVARALADAELLALDLPEPDDVDPDRDLPRMCGRTHPNTGWPDLAYCTRTKNHAGPHYSTLKDLSWSETERKPSH